MAGNSFGKNFMVTTWGESHGPCIGAVIDGCPSGLSLNENDIQQMLNRRHGSGSSNLAGKRREPDTVRILSGVFCGKTTGAPISVIIDNTDVHSADYESLKNVYRPGHADFTMDAKYGIRDYRGGGRSSGRETVTRIAAGAIAMKILNNLGISIESSISVFEANKNQPEGDSYGGTVTLTINEMPAGIGEPVFEKLDACLAKALMSIGAVKAVEIGSGIDVSLSSGSKNNDIFEISENGKNHLDNLLSPEERKKTMLEIQRRAGKHMISKQTNHAGGILGGISDGDPIVVKIHFKPVPSISIPQNTITETGDEVTVTVLGRHDFCIAEKSSTLVYDCL